MAAAVVGIATAPCCTIDGEVHSVVSDSGCTRGTVSDSCTRRACSMGSTVQFLVLLPDDVHGKLSWGGLAEDILQLTCFLCKVQRTEFRARHRHSRKYVVFSLLLKNGVFWDVTPCGSCKN
jgi:hypothetical protein